MFCKGKGYACLSSAVFPVPGTVPGLAHNRCLINICLMNKWIHSLRVRKPTWLDMSALERDLVHRWTLQSDCRGAVSNSLGEVFPRRIFGPVKGRLWGQWISGRDMSKKWGYCVLSQCLSIVILKLVLKMSWLWDGSVSHHSFTRGRVVPRWRAGAESWVWIFSSVTSSFCIWGEGTQILSVSVSLSIVRIKWMCTIYYIIIYMYVLFIIHMYYIVT